MWMQPTTSVEGRTPPRIRNIGHLKRIANKLVQLGNNNNGIESHLQLFQISCFMCYQFFMFVHVIFRIRIRPVLLCYSTTQGTRMFALRVAHFAFDKYRFLKVHLAVPNTNVFCFFIKWGNQGK